MTTVVVVVVVVVAVATAGAAGGEVVVVVPLVVVLQVSKRASRTVSREVLLFPRHSIVAHTAILSCGHACLHPCHSVLRFQGLFVLCACAILSERFPSVDLNGQMTSLYISMLYTFVRSHLCAIRMDSLQLNAAIFYILQPRVTIV